MKTFKGVRGTLLSPVISIRGWLHLKCFIFFFNIVQYRIRKWCQAYSVDYLYLETKIIIKKKESSFILQLVFDCHYQPKGKCYLSFFLLLFRILLVLWKGLNPLLQICQWGWLYTEKYEIMLREIYSIVLIKPRIFFFF